MGKLVPATHVHLLSPVGPVSHLGTSLNCHLSSNVRWRGWIPLE